MILPVEIVRSVDRYIARELDDSRKYDNREPLDDSGVYSLHQLAAQIYAEGWDHGERAQSERDRAARQRERDAEVTP